MHYWLGRQFLTKMCPNYVFLDALSIGNIPDLKWRPTKIVTLLPCPYRAEYLTLPSSESRENLENGINIEENLLWSRFCASLGSRRIELLVRGVGSAHQKSALLVRSPISNKNVSQLGFFGRSFDWQHS